MRIRRGERRKEQGGVEGWRGREGAPHGIFAGTPSRRLGEWEMGNGEMPTHELVPCLRQTGDGIDWKLIGAIALKACGSEGRRMRGLN